MSKISLEQAVKKVFGDSVKQKDDCEIFDWYHFSAIIYDSSEQKATIELGADVHPYYSRITSEWINEMHENMFFLLGRGYGPYQKRLEVKDGVRSQYVIPVSVMSHQYVIPIKNQRDLTKVCKDIKEMLDARKCVQ